MQSGLYICACWYYSKYLDSACVSGICDMRKVDLDQAMCLLIQKIKHCINIY